MEINLESVSLVLEALALASGAVLAAFWIGLAVWTVRDIRTRSRDIFAWLLSGLLVLLFNLLGLALYLLMRPKETLAEAYERALEEEVLLEGLESRATCPQCHKPVQPDFLLCPACRTHLKKRCASCQRLLELDWSVCPYCGYAVAGQAAQRFAVQEAAETTLIEQTEPPLDAEETAEIAPPEDVFYATDTEPPDGMSEED